MIRALVYKGLRVDKSRTTYDISTHSTPLSAAVTTKYILTWPTPKAPKMTANMAVKKSTKVSVPSSTRTAPT